MRRILLFAFIAAFAGCGGDKTTTTPIPPNAKVMQTFVNAGMSAIFPGLDRFGTILPLLVNHSSPAALPYNFQPDPTPGAPPNSFTFTLPLDLNGDGTNDSSAPGSLQLSDEPSMAATPGFSGSVQIALDNALGTGQFSGHFVTLEHGAASLSGTGALVDAVTGYSTNVTIPADHPLTANIATGGTSSQPNACAYSLSGTAGVEVSGELGTLFNDFVFSPNQRTVTATHAVYTDPEGHATSLPDRSVTVPCGSGSINDWAGEYLLDWSCLPGPDNGQARITITVTGPNSIHIVDEDPPGSGEILEYDATATPGDPHVVRGLFVTSDTPEVGPYTEHFSWIMDPARNSFVQVSVYLYNQHPDGGICSATAVRQTSDKDNH